MKTDQGSTTPTTAVGAWLRKSRPYLILGTLSLLGLVFGASLALAKFDAHRARITGRTDTPRVLCNHCHFGGPTPLMEPSTDGPRYVNPTALAVSPDGDRLYVVSSTRELLLEVDLGTNTISRSVQVGAQPRDLDITPDGLRIAVTCRADDEVWLVDALSMTVTERVSVGAEPTGVAFAHDSEQLFVANSGSGTLEMRPLDPAARPIYVEAGEEPLAVALSGDGKLLCAVNRRVQPGPPDAVLGSEITLVDVTRGRVSQRRTLRSAHLGRDIVLSSDGTFALTPIVHFRNLLPLTQVARGAVMTHALAWIETREGGADIQFPLDDVNTFFADPAGVALTPDDRIAFVAHGGANLVTAVDVDVLRDLCAQAADQVAAYPDDLGLSARYVLGRIPTLAVPEALAMAPDGEHLYVAERLADSIAVIDVATLEVVERIDLDGPSRMTSERRGERVFHDASATFQGQFSCSSCHPEGHTDSIVWDFEIDGVGKNLLETRSLRGIRDTPPFKWNGKNPDLHTQCGPRFARVLMRSEAFTPAKLDDLVAYIESIPLRSKRAPAEYGQARERGRQIFFRTQDENGEEIPRIGRCSTCHRPPLYTDRFMADVGTGGKFDTPHLFDVQSSAPYLHDGRARTLEEIWTVHSLEDTHGRTNDLSKIDLNDLVSFLRSL